MIDFSRVFGLTQLKKSPADALKKIQGSSDPLYILSRGKPVGVLLDVDLYHKLEEATEELWIAKEIEKANLNEEKVSLETALKQNISLKERESTTITQGK